MNLSDDDFALFDLPRQYAVMRADLDGRWRALQAQVHPDRFAAEGAAAQRLAMQWAVRVNEAYGRLKDPIARGAYLCSLAGVAVSGDSSTPMPPAFLMQQMAWREALDDADGAQGVQRLDDEVAAEEARLFERLRVQLDEQADAAAAAGTVRSLMFVSKFRQDIDRRLETLDT